MKRRPAPATRSAAGAMAENECVQAVDGALGFVSKQRWVPRPLAVALIETVGDKADASSQPFRVRELVERALSELEDDPLTTPQVTDRLLDLRNAARPARAQLAESANP